MESKTILASTMLGLCLTIGPTIDRTNSFGQQQDEVSSQSATATADKSPLPFPRGFDYPANPGALEKMIANRDLAAVRQHGWYLWAGINQPGRDGWPIWRSWSITTQVFAADSGLLGAPEGGQSPSPSGTSLKILNAAKSPPPISYPIPFYTIPDVVRAKYRDALADTALSADVPDGANFQNNGDLMLVSEAFSTEAYDSIRNHKLNLRSTLNALMYAGQPDVPSLAPRSIVLKHMYWPVKQDGLTALPVWDNPSSIGSYTGFEIQSQWKRAIAIDPSRHTIPASEMADVTFLYGVRQPDGVTPLGPNTYKRVKVVSIGDFYFKRITAADYATFDINDKILLDLSFYWAHNRPFRIGDYVVSIASHIITKEIPEWTLQSAWWSDKPNQGKHSTDRPAIPQAKGPWQHYLLTTAYGITVQPNGNELPVSFNPYIELASHPIETNCRNCHVRAAWPNGSYLALPVPPNPNSTADIQPDNAIFKNMLRTDFLWTIEARAK